MMIFGRGTLGGTKALVLRKRIFTFQIENSL